MNIEISGRNYEVTERVRELVESKIEKLRKYFQDIIEVRCVLNVEKKRNVCEIMIIGRDHDAKSIQEGDTMEEAIQRCADAIKRQAGRQREKILDQRHGKGGNGGVAPTEWRVDVLEPGAIRASDNEPPRIIKSTNIPIRPMSIEEAAMMLDDSRNEFIVFQDLDTEKVTVIYRRRDNNFGMIAPEF